MTDDADVDRLEDVEVRLSADEIAMLAVLVGIAVGCVIIAAWLVSNGVDGVMALFGR